MIRRYASLVISQAADRIVSFLWLIYLARALAVDDYGRYGTIMASISIGTSLIDFGMAFITIRDLAVDKKEAPHYLGAQIVQRLGSGLLVSLIILGMVWFRYGNSVTFWLFALACGHMVFHNTGMIGDTIFAAYQRQGYIAALDLLHSTGWAVLGYLTLRLHLGLPDLFMAMSINSAFVCMVYSFLILRYFVRPRFDFSMAFFTNLLRQAAPIGLTGVFGMVYDRVDRIILSWCHGTYETGLYNAAASLVSPINDMIWGAAIIILYPVMASLYRDLEAFRQVFKTVLVWLFGMSVAVVAATLVLGDRIILFLYGGKYAGSGTYLKLLILYLLVLPFHGFLGRLLMIQRRQILYTWANASATAINIALNFLLIPPWHALGACWATLLTHLSLPFLYYLISGESLKGYWDGNLYIRLLAAGALAAAFIASIPAFQVIGQLAIFLALYIPMAFYLINFQSSLAHVQHWIHVREGSAG